MPSRRECRAEAVAAQLRSLSRIRLCCDDDMYDTARSIDFLRALEPGMGAPAT